MAKVIQCCPECNGGILDRIEIFDSYADGLCSDCTQTPDEYIIPVYEVEHIEVDVFEFINSL